MAKITIARDPEKPRPITIAKPGATSGPAFMVGKKAGQQLNVSPSQELVSDFSNYDAGYTEAQGNRDAYRERMQSAFEMWRNSLTQAGGEVVLGAGVLVI
jgi:hypothetical protein